MSTEVRAMGALESADFTSLFTAAAEEAEGAAAVEEVAGAAAASGALGFVSAAAGGFVVLAFEAAGAAVESGSVLAGSLGRSEVAALVAAGSCLVSAVCNAAKKRGVHQEVADASVARGQRREGGSYWLSRLGGIHHLWCLCRGSATHLAKP